MLRFIIPENKNMTIKIPILIIDIDGQGCHPLIKAVFNSKQKGFLIIDTGASNSVFDLKLLENIVEIIPQEPDTLKSAGISEGLIENKLGILKKLKIGELSLPNFPVIMLDLSHINTMYKKFFNKPIWGLLGGDFLRRYKAKINYKNSCLVLEIPKPNSKKNNKIKK